MSKYSWCVGVTTCPREESTLYQCIKSLNDNSWKPVVFFEPGNYNEDISDLDNYSFKNNHTKGAWHNWLDSAKFMIKNTNADVIMTVQDDSLFAQNIQSDVESYLDECMNEDFGFMSLYTARDYQYKYLVKDSAKNDKIVREFTYLHQIDKYMQKYNINDTLYISKEVLPFGVHKVSIPSLWGACALIFSRSSLESIVNHPIAESWVGPNPKNPPPYPHLIKNIDTAIGQIINDLNKNAYFVQPSFVSHIGSVSTLGHRDNSGNRNCEFFKDDDAITPTSIPAFNKIEKIPYQRLEISEEVEKYIFDKIPASHKILEFGSSSISEELFKKYDYMILESNEKEYKKLERIMDDRIKKTYLKDGWYSTHSIMDKKFDTIIINGIDFQNINCDIAKSLALLVNGGCNIILNYCMNNKVFFNHCLGQKPQHDVDNNNFIAVRCILK